MACSNPSTAACLRKTGETIGSLAAAFTGKSGKAFHNIGSGNAMRTFASFSKVKEQQPLLPLSPWATRTSPLNLQKRQMSSNVSQTLHSTIQKEIAHEKSNYEQAKELTNFIRTSGWTLTEKANDMLVVLSKKAEGRTVTVEFSCIQNADAGDRDDESPVPEMSDFTVTVTNQDGSGLLFYCSTTQDEEDKHRFCIGQIRHLDSAESKENLSEYPGPYFEDLDDSFQQGIDEWLSKLGIDAELCDFIDGYSVDKENREYIDWLQKLSKCVAQSS